MALALASLRVTAKVSPSGLERAIATLVVGVTIAVIEALALGLVALGTSTVALTAAALATWAAASLLMPAPAVRPTAELAGWWAGLDGHQKLVAGALAGAFAAWVVWLLRFPSIGFDSAVYHYPDIAGWIANGRPGSILQLSYDIPYGNYPLTDEIAQTWGAAIARSYVPLALWNPLLAVALTAATWLTLRNLSVPRWASALATAALLATPLLVRELNEPQTDLPAMAWLACTAALATGAGRRPALLVPALLAAGLGIGTKPTVAPAALTALAFGAYLARGRLRPLMGWLGVGLAGAFAVGGFWYARNIVQHGSPVWPFVDVPWGDPSPRFLGLIDKTFLDRPAATLDGRLGQYTALLGGAWLTLLAALCVIAIGAIAPLSRRGPRLALVVSGSVALVGLLIWSVSWGTGLQTSAELPTPSGWPLSTIRYLLPVIGAATVAVALATRVPGAVRRLAALALMAALVWSVVADARLGTPYTPSATTLLMGAVAGVLGAAALILVTRRVPAPAHTLRPIQRGAVAVVAAVAAGMLLTPVGSGFINRSTRVVGSTAPAPELVSWFLDQPDYDDGDWTISLASRAVISSLAGDHFRHPLELIPAHTQCKGVRALASRTPLLVTSSDWFLGIIGLNPYSAPGCLHGRPAVYQKGDYTVYWPERGGTVAADSSAPEGASFRPTVASAPITRTLGSGTMKRPPRSR
jgi:hypothetical protein